MDAYAKFLAESNALRHATCELELVTKLALPTGSTSEVTHTRRGVCKRVTRRGNVARYEFADVDRSALTQVFPFETFSVADFPALFTDHVGMRIPQGVGTVTKIPLAWISNSGGSYVYAGPKVIGTAGTVLAVYRGTQPGRGALVNASEYTVGTTTFSGGSLVTVTFTAEQKDKEGRAFLIEADFSLPGSRYPADEIARLLALYGIATDSTSFAAATTYDTTAGFLIDACYGGKGRTGVAIISDLLQVARAWITPNSVGGWALVQDAPKSATREFNTAGDLIEITEHGDGDIQRTISLNYRPRCSIAEDFAGLLTRTTTGQTGEKQLRNPYIRDHVVADKLLSYWQARMNTLRVARGTVYAAQMNNGERITVTDAVNWAGNKDFLITGIARPADANAVTLREYDAGIYTYAAEPLSSDATNGYTADYTFTRPLAPTGLTVVSQGTSSDTDGKTTAYALIRATPPTVNWSRLMVAVVDTTTNEQHIAQLLLNGANYEVSVPGLRPNRAHTVIAWAVNGNGVEGVATSSVPFTSSNATTALGAPTVTVTQVQSFEVKVRLSAVSDVSGQPRHRRNILFEKVGAGTYTEVQRGEEREFIRTVSHGATYYYKARSEDQNGNESSDSSEVNITPVKKVDGTYIPDASINQGRSYTGTGSASVTVLASSSQGVDMDVYSFFPNLDHSNSAIAAYVTSALTKSGANDQGRFRLANLDASSSVSVDIDWRKFNP